MSTETVNLRKVDLVSKLLAQAEGAGTPEEAATFMAKAQEVASANAIDLAVARAHQQNREKRQEPERRSFRVTTGYRLDSTAKWLMELFIVLCETNDCELTLGQHYAFPVGFPGDLDVVEALYTSLAVQMVAQCNAALKRGDHKVVQRLPKQVREEIPNDERAWGEPVNPESWESERCYVDSQEEYDRTVERFGADFAARHYPLPPKTRLVHAYDESGGRIYEDRKVSAVDGRTFRANFYQGFVYRLRSRLWEAKRAAEKAAGVEAHGDTSTSTGLALRDKRSEVAAKYAEEIGDRKLGTHHAPTVPTDHTGRGITSGQSAAANAGLGLDDHAVGRTQRAEIG